MRTEIDAVRMALVLGVVGCLGVMWAWRRFETGWESATNCDSELSTPQDGLRLPVPGNCAT
jgi:hypothetical protein